MMMGVWSEVCAEARERKNTTTAAAAAAVAAAVAAAATAVLIGFADVTLPRETLQCAILL